MRAELPAELDTTSTAGEAPAQTPRISSGHDGAAPEPSTPPPPPPGHAPSPLRGPMASLAGSVASSYGGGGAVTGPHDKARLLECAHKVIRALCKLAMLTSNVPGDTSVTAGRALAMELLAGVLINHGAHFKRFPKLMAVVKGELGNCLLANSKSASAVLQRLTCQIFVVVLQTFREELKTKVRASLHPSTCSGKVAWHSGTGRYLTSMHHRCLQLSGHSVCARPLACDLHNTAWHGTRLCSKSVHTWVQVAYLFRHTVLKGLEPAADGRDATAALDYRLVVFRCLDPLCADGQLLMDLFVNFDCDPDHTETVLLERLFKALNGCITNPDALAEPGAAGPMPTAQRNMLRYAALKYLGQAMRALYEWHESLSGAPPACLPASFFPNLQY
jgi:Guanine nucleotide exchange factor in Golgi transport N-terminal